jgi:hypothetical protein
VKYPWLERSYELGRPFALLLPVETLGAASCQRLINLYGVEVILMDKRINFKMPNKGYSGKGSDFPTYWHTWGLGIGQQITCVNIAVYPDEQYCFALPGAAVELQTRVLDQDDFAE